MVVHVEDKVLALYRMMMNGQSSNVAHMLPMIDYIYHDSQTNKTDISTIHACQDEYTFVLVQGITYVACDMLR